MGALYEAATAEHALWEAWERVGGRRGTAGSDGRSRAQPGEDPGALVTALAKELRDFSYAPLPARQVFIPKTGSPGEHRELELPALRDKIVQQAIRQVIEPRFESRFLDCSYAYRPRKGPARAIRRVLHELHHGRIDTVARGDADDYFDSIPHEPLLELVGAVVGDEDLLRLIRLFVTNGVLEVAGGLVDPLSGVPTGSVIAPLLSNAYLHELDAHLRARDIRHVRYADDWILLAQGLAQAKEAAAEAEEYATRRLGLRLNDGGHSIIQVAEGFAFLGFWVRRGKLAIDRARLERVQSRLEYLSRRTRRWPFSERVAALAETCRGWQRYYRLVDRKEDLQRLDELIGAYLARAVAEAASEAPDAQELERLLEDFPWPGTDASLAEAHLRGALEAEAERRRREAATQRAVRRRRRQAKGHAAERSEIVVWRSGARLEAVSARLVLRDEGGSKLLERPIGRVRSLQIRGRGVQVSSGALELCASSDVPVSFLSRKGTPVAILHAPGSLRIELLTLQLEASRSRAGMELGVAFARAKVKNQANLLKYLAKYRRKADPAVHRALLRGARDAQAEARRLNDVVAGWDGSDAWRGQTFAAEGRAAESYWSAVTRILDGFPGRRKQDATDPINAALSYGYAILYARIEEAILRAGLHSGLGFLHKGSRGRPALAFDLVEPLRAPVVDRTVIAMASRRQPLDLDGGGRLTGNTRKALAGNILERWWTETPYGDGYSDYESILGDQLRRVIRRLRGEAPFRPFLQRW